MSASEAEHPAPGELRPFTLFRTLDEAALAPWAEVVRLRPVKAGDVLVEQGAPSDVYLLFEGTAHTMVVQGENTEMIGRMEAPGFMGAVAALTGTAVDARIVAASDGRVGTIGREDFTRLTLAHPGVHARIMELVGPVTRTLAGIEGRRERLTSLGTMAAGLAHELNNPAAAARRAAAQMAEAVDVVTGAIAEFVNAGVTRERAGLLVALQQEALRGAATQDVHDALAAADAEDELLERLEDLGVPEPWELVEPLVAAGLDAAWVDRVAEAAEDATGAALGWVAATLTVRGLAGELQESTTRMSDLVGAIKSYAYMDRGGLVEVDVHEGLETTLKIMNHKLKHTAIRVERAYDKSLPKVTVMGSELNQVWTNLIDNAIAALGETGTIAIATKDDGGCVLVELSDDGPGIPADVRDRIFDPFFTTKEVGQGTGLGLSTARQIVVDRHGGSLTVTSDPGAGTTFHIWIPYAPVTKLK